MRKTLVTLTAAAVLALVACGSDEPMTDESMGSDPVSGESPAGDPMTEPMDAEEGAAAAATEVVPGRYVDLATYQADATAYEDGRVVLFFHADWCPHCRDTHASLVEDGVPDGLTVVQVDYDAETGLRQEYGVVQQHTFVQVDADGAALATWTGSADGQDILARTG